MIKAKEKWISEQCDNIEKGIKESNSKKAFDTLKKLTRKQSTATVIEDKNGFLLTDNATVLTRWTEYSQGLHNYEQKPDTSILKSKTRSVDETDDMQVMKEVKEALRALKGGKSNGADNVPAELLKHGGAEMVKFPHSTMPEDLENKGMAQIIDHSMLIPLPEKRKSKTMQTLQNHQPHQSPKQHHATNHLVQIQRKIRRNTV